MYVDHIHEDSAEHAMRTVPVPFAAVGCSAVRSPAPRRPLLPLASLSATLLLLSRFVLFLSRSLLGPGRCASQQFVYLFVSVVYYA